ncbi:hypothetical protein DL770_009725 [Monosporascus sp. CRB-9-2]|nr:hypothetical protein DL770_009725 [Monosporascus sp. CRB-9-2]
MLYGFRPILLSGLELLIVISLVMVCLAQLFLLFSFLWLDISSALSFGGKPNSLIKPYRAVPLQDIVTWDAHSIFVRGERILFYSGEFHPFRLPSPGLWLDVFQKIRALGHVSFDGVFALEPFFEAATEAGIYLLARPGPYINSELSGGGLPGWLQRIKAPVRTATQEFLNATEKYVETVGSIIAKAQITNGGPVILFQPENEYTSPLAVQICWNLRNSWIPNTWPTLRINTGERTYGGTNWGNMGHPLGYTSYDHGAAVKEDRTIVREKYSEAKLEAHFLQASPAYLTAIPGNPTYGAYAQNVDVAVTLLSGAKTQFYVTGGSLTLYGRDSKIHVVDYDVGGINLIYSSAEIYTWKRSGNKSVLLLYGGERETHEFALSSELGKPSVEGNGVKITQKGSETIVQWTATPSRKVLHYGQSLDVYLLWRNDAYNYWVLDLPAPAPMGNYTSFSKANSSVIVKAGYILRSAAVSGTTLYLTGDLMLRQNFRYETECTYRTSNNPRNLTTPTSLYGGDYGFHAGSLIYRGHFTATGHERTFNLSTQGGFAFGHTVWLNKAFLGSWPGIDAYENYNQTFNLPSLIGGGQYVLTVVMDHMGMYMEFVVGSNTMKAPRGILDYSLEGHAKSDVVWKMTGNLGGEQYRDLVRGPLNEGAMYAERQGYHLPDPSSQIIIITSPAK